MELRTHLVMSSGHITEDVAVALDAIARDESAFGDWRDYVICRANGDCGWWVFIERRCAAATEALFPECLKACLALARAANVDWLLLDSKTDPSSHVAFHDW